MPENQLPDRFYPESVFTNILGYKLIPVGEYTKEITKDTLMVYHWKLGKPTLEIAPHLWQDRLDFNRRGPMKYYTYKDIYDESHFKRVDTSFYLMYYHNNPDKKEEILHHNFCILEFKGP